MPRRLTQSTAIRLDWAELLQQLPLLDTAIGQKAAAATAVDKVANVFGPKNFNFVWQQKATATITLGNCLRLTLSTRFLIYALILIEN